MTFQEIIETLNSFWAKHGCIIAQPYGIEVGAGTSNPHTFFRVLGPEPYSVAYIEPSRRPTDGRYGQNPNRLQHYYQYQVILKPAPEFNQELYIESLRALGIDPKEHDIRFVEDNWEATPLGAWGLGWEVWLDGMEVSQYTYFQQVAGIPLEVPALEITYGLERLAMYIQKVNDYRDLKWNAMTTYGDIFEKHEFWQATHNYETASIDSLQKIFEIYEKEAQTQINLANYWAAYDYVLKLSHAFNLLDARGAISVSDRIAKFALMAKLSKQVGKMYLKEREDMGYPLKGKTVPVEMKLPQKTHKEQTDDKNIAVVEIGFEELPATYLTEWSSILENWFKSFSEQKSLFTEAHLMLTPRRIVIKLENPQTEVIEESIVTGPTWSKAFDLNEAPSPALMGFLKKYNADIKDVYKEDKQGIEVTAIKVKVSKSICEFLQEAVNHIFELAPRTKFMRWQQGVDSFIRPIRWVFAYHNDTKLDITAWTISSANKTYAPRYLDAAEVEVHSAQAYLSYIESVGIQLDHHKRKAHIEEARSIHENVSRKFDEYVIHNTYLTERAVLKTVELPEKYLQLPEELITYILEKNQMYLMSFENGKTYYTIVANQMQPTADIVEGNAKVARARLEDGLFYMNQDSAMPLSAFREKLAALNFHPKLGSYFSKVERIDALSTYILNSIKVPKADKVRELTHEALKYIKNDRATNLAKEFPKLEGTIGYRYALRDGLSEDVASILRDHYAPNLEKVTDNTSARAIASLILHIADRVDSFISLSKVEPLPEASHDPYEMRKMTYDIIIALVNSGLHINILELFTYAQPLAAIDDAARTQLDEIMDFVNIRLQQYLQDSRSIENWIAHGTAYSTGNDLTLKAKLATELHELEEKHSIKDSFLDSLKRLRNILKQTNIEQTEINTALFETKSEKEVFELIEELDTITQDTNVKFGPFFEKLASTLHTFFEETMVNAEDEKLKKNRISLLKNLHLKLEDIFALNFE